MAEKCNCGAALPTLKKKIIRRARCKAIYLWSQDLFGNYSYILISK